MSPFDLVLQRLADRGYKPRMMGREKAEAHCPGHDDRNSSLSVSVGRDGCCVVHCHADCPAEDVLAPLDLTLADLFAASTKKKMGPRRTTVHAYREGDKLLYEQVRDDFADGTKKIWTRYPNGKTRKRTLYRLDELLRRDPPDRWVVFPEGEKCVDRLVAEGFVATTNSHGADGWRDDLAQHLRGAQVAILADNDEPGAKLAESKARSLAGVADVVKIVELDGLPVKGDVVDWLDNGGTADELKRTILEAPEWQPSAPSDNAGNGDDLPDLDLDPEQAKAVDDLLEQIKHLDEGDQKDALKALTSLLGKETQATQLVKLAEDAGIELWHDPEETGYATIPVVDHLEHWSLRSRPFRLWLRRRFYEEFESAPNANAVRDAVEVLDGKALFVGDEHNVHVRVAEHLGVVYLDLCDDAWRCVEITATGWAVRNGAPVRFRRAKGMLSLPLPQPGEIGELRPFVNVTDNEWPLVVGVLLGMLRPHGPYPLLNVTSEHGSAKTTVCRVLRRCVDPNTADLRAAPSDTRDLAIAANNGWVAAFDNLSVLWPQLSDDLARLSTGAGFATRKLYENDEEQLFNASRPVIVNGIEDVVTRPDLLDRTIIVQPPRIDDDQRRKETEFWAAFEEAWPRILGALLDAVSCALARLDDVVLERLPRMADFATWVVAAEPALGIAEGSFVAAYDTNRAEAQGVALEASPATAAILRFVEAKGTWTGSAGELAELLKPDRPPKGWPVTPQGMAGALNRGAPVLRQHGVDVVKGERVHGLKPWTLTKREART